MPDCGTVPADEGADGCIVEVEHRVREVAQELPREGYVRVAARRALKIRDSDAGGPRAQVLEEIEVVAQASLR